MFPHVLRDPIEDTNTLLVAQHGAAVGRAPARGAAATCRSACAPTAPEAAAAARARRCGAASVYTDDKAPVEWLIDKSIVDYAAGDDDRAE